MVFYSQLATPECREDARAAQVRVRGTVPVTMRRGYRVVGLAVAIVICTIVLAAGMAQARDHYADARNRLVDQEILGAGIENPRVIAAMRATPRHMFVLPSQRDKAYYDMALPIGGGQTISPPFVVALMTEKLDPQPDDRVLEIGTGSGYQAAVLSHLVAQVYSIEIVPLLGRRSARTLKKLGYRNVHTRIGDGYQGWAEHAPFDKIIVTCSPERVPQPLVAQLAEGGRMIVPLGERFQQTLYLFTKVGGKLRRESVAPTFFVPMTGLAERQRQVLPVTGAPGLVHGGFEETIDSTDQPAGWYYVRQGRVEAMAGTPAGQHCLALTNTTPGRYAHAMQAFGVDGRLVRQLKISLWVRGEGLGQGQTVAQQAGLLVEFYGADRAPVGRYRWGPWRGTFGWTRKVTRIPVPAPARLAVIGIGLFGGTGTARFDDVQVHAADR